MTYKFKSDLHTNLFMKIPIILFEDGHWANLPPASKEVCPVICKFVDEALKGFPGFEKKSYSTKRLNRAYRYEIEPAPRENKLSISINHSFFNGGNWTHLIPTAKAVYPILKLAAWWEFNDYDDYEQTGMALHEHNDVYLTRDYDFVTADEDIVADLAGVSRRSLHSAYASLVEKDFLKFLDLHEGLKRWKIFTKPPLVYQVEYLNETVEKRYVGAVN
jgi:hypothetical protein